MIVTRKIESFWTEYYRKVSEGCEPVWFGWNGLLYIGTLKEFNRVKNKL